MNQTRTVVLGGARTPIGKLSGSLSNLKAADLGGFAIAEALRRSGVAPQQIGYVVMGEVLQAGQGQLVARQAAVRAEIPMEVPAMTLNKVCLSGMNAIHLADLMVRAGEAQFVVAGGMESMSQAPYLLPGARSGYRFGDQQIFDAVQIDGLTCAFEHRLMGDATDSYASAFGITRERQDEVAARSHERASIATKNGHLSEEIVGIAVPQRRGDPISVESDEGIRVDTTFEKLAQMRPAFSKDGTITAGNASQISDGAAAVVVTTLEHAESLGVAPLCEIVGHGQVAGPDPSLLTQPSRAIRAALERSGVDLGDIDLFEINEAFASVAIASMHDLGIPDEIVNVNGGAIALGHPIGMSGARLVLSLGYELRRQGAHLGVAALCGGGGQGEALLVRAI